MIHHLFHSSRYVSCAVYVEPTEDYPSASDLIYTGCQDGKIRSFLPALEEPLHVLDGHAEYVTSIYVGKFGTLVSGSWDMTAKVWMDRSCKATLTGHTLAVWAVAILPTVGVMVTASADKTIKLWKVGQCTHTLTGSASSSTSPTPAAGPGWPQSSSPSSSCWRRWTGSRRS